MLENGFCCAVSVAKRRHNRKIGSELVDNSFRVQEYVHKTYSCTADCRTLGHCNLKSIAAY